MFKLSFNSNIVGTGSLMSHDNLYLLDTIATYGESLNMETSGTERKIDIIIQEHYGTSALVTYLKIELSD